MLSVICIIVTSCLVGVFLGCGNDGNSGGGDIDAATPADAQTENYVIWATGRYSLSASDFYIEINGEKFLAPVSGLDISGDEGDATAMTTELTWQENNVEMRLFIYYASDGTDWWVDLIRTYNAEGSAEWINYSSPNIGSSLGSAFSGDVAVDSDTGEAIAGKINFTGLMLEAFK